MTAAKEGGEEPAPKHAINSQKKAGFGTNPIVLQHILLSVQAGESFVWCCPLTARLRAVNNSRELDW